jgi:plastocyanin
MNHGRALLSGVLVGLVITRVAVPARGQDDNPAAGGPPTRVEFKKLQSDVREQRELIISMLQTEQQRYDMLLRLLGGQGGGATMVPLPASPEAAVSVPAENSPRRPRAEVERRIAAIEGKVSGGEPGEVYVYIENAKGPPVRNKTIEIRQEGKQFSPRVAVVQTGTNIVFPNYDSIYHNVFSASARNSFDLGSFRAGDKPRAVTMTAPGVVQIFCNMHQKMSADVLVVPNALYTKVRPDGSYRIENVPVGQRKVVAWSPHTKPVQQGVDVTATGAQVSFALTRQEVAVHTNKMGQAYGSYRE